MRSAALHNSGHGQFRGKYSGEHARREPWHRWRELGFAIAHHRILLTPYHSMETGDDAIIGEWERRLRRFSPFILDTFYVNALMLADFVERKGIAPLPIPALFVLGTLEAAERTRLGRIFGGKIFNRYSPHECEGIAVACPQHDGMHVAIDSYLVEILDDRNVPLGPAEVGNVVVTDFENFTMPLIRYEIGDLAQHIAAPCPCGRTFPRISDLHGRKSDILGTCRGRPVAPWDAERLLQGHPKILYFQICRTLRGVTIQVVTKRGAHLDAEETAACTQRIAELFDPALPVGIELADSVHFEPNGKYRFAKNALENPMPPEEMPPITLPMSRPSVGAPELERIGVVFASGMLGEGALVAEFEERLRAFTGAAAAVAVNTGTSALHLALRVLDIGPGDEVILPSLTFVADAMAVLMAGARPIFGDISESTWNLDPDRLHPLISRHTKAIMPTDYAGLPADVGRIRTVIGDRDIRIVRDASHSFGSQVDGRAVGAWAGEDITCFSFDPIKKVTCGEGGAMALNDLELASRARIMKRLGRTGQNQVGELGFRYHMSDINAAIGLTQLEHFAVRARKRQQIAREYDERLARCAQVTLSGRDWNEIVPFMYVVRVPKGDRRGLIDHLRGQGVHADLRYAPCHHQALFGQQSATLPVTEAVAADLLSLPLFVEMTSDNVRTVVQLIEGYFRRT
jgi:perosamine synthetase